MGAGASCIQRHYCFPSDNLELFSGLRPRFTWFAAWINVPSEQLKNARGDTYMTITRTGQVDTDVFEIFYGGFASARTNQREKGWRSTTASSNGQETLRVSALSQSHCAPTEVGSVQIPTW